MVNRRRSCAQSPRRRRRPPAAIATELATATSRSPLVDPYVRPAVAPRACHRRGTPGATSGSAPPLQPSCQSPATSLHQLDLSERNGDRHAGALSVPVVNVVVDHRPAGHRSPNALDGPGLGVAGRRRRRCNRRGRLDWRLGGGDGDGDERSGEQHGGPPWSPTASECEIQSRGGSARSAPPPDSGVTLSDWSLARRARGRVQPLELRQFAANLGAERSRSSAASARGWPSISGRESARRPPGAPG